MAANTVTLYISDTNMRLMTTRGKRITKLADMPLETSLGEIDTPEKEAQMAEKVKALFKNNRISARKVILGISGLHCLTRPIDLPELPKAMLQEAVTREAKRVLPVPIDQLYISWQTISVSEGKQQIFMVAIPAQIADVIVRAVQQAGYKPYMMDIKPLALARLANEPNTIIIDVQPSEFDIVIMVNGMPQPVRTVPFPRDALSIKEKADVVKDELKRTIQFYNTNNPEMRIQAGMSLQISGELAEETELYENLGQEYELKPTLLTSPLKCLKQLDPSRHLVNVGLALKELHSGTGSALPDFNTLPTPYLPRQISLNKLLAIPATAAAIGIVIMLGLTVQDAAANLENTKIELDSNKVLLDKRQAQKNELLDNIAALEAEIAVNEVSRESYAVALDTISWTSTSMNSDLNAAVDNVVTDLEIGSLGIAGDTINIRGKAKTEQEVMQYVRELTDTGRFEEITIANITRTAETSDNVTVEIMTYSLTVKLMEEE